ncbi:MAG: GGDEF domain-containing protein [Acholeplasmataceae bacterium]|nr:GGDEF domain-containing protein [Acholeplasmataceae bacterium]
MTLTLIALATIDIVALLMLIGLLRKENLLTDQFKKFFKYSVFIAIFIITNETGSYLVNNQSVGLKPLNEIFNVVGFALSPLVPLLLIEIFGENVIKRNKYIVIPTIVNAIASILSPWFGFIFHVSTLNVYERGNLFFIFVLVYITNIAILSYVAWLNGKERFFPIKWKILGLALFTLVGSSVQLILPNVLVTWHCVTLALFLLYLLLSEYDASFDALTNLYNRQAFENATKMLNHKKDFSVVLIDINNFKETNDIYGHDTGDLALKETSEVIKKAFGNKLNGYRIGGDEICIIFRSSDEKMLKKHLVEMSTELELKRKKHFWMPTISYGYSINDGVESTTFQEVYKKADQYMYLQKAKQKQEVN